MTEANINKGYGWKQRPLLALYAVEVWHPLAVASCGVETTSITTTPINPIAATTANIVIVIVFIPMSNNLPWGCVLYKDADINQNSSLHLTLKLMFILIIWKYYIRFGDFEKYTQRDKLKWHVRYLSHLFKCF